MRLWSIRFTLTLWYQATLAVILGLFSWVLYTTFSASLHHDVDKGLALQATSVTDTVLAFWRAERSAPLSGPGNWATSPSGTFEEVFDTGQLPALISRWAEKTAGLQSIHPARILDRAGHPLTELGSFAQLSLPVTDSVIAQALDGAPVYQTMSVNFEPLRLLTYPATHNGRVLYFIQTAGSLKHVEDSLAGLRLWLLWLAPLTLIGTSVIGWFFATMALRPVGRMTRQAQRIGAERMEDRLDVPKTGDELERLAETFNDLLARLEQAFRRMRQFSAAASHELRTPLTAMKGELEVVLRKPRQPGEYRSVIHTQLQLIDQMAHLVEELLMLARSDVVKGAIEFHPVEIGALVRQVSDLWDRSAEAKGIRLVIAIPKAVWVRGEPRLLERVVSNLLDNAIRHTPAGGRITVSTERHDGQACLIVQDTGPGIPTTELPHIFDRFFKPPVATNGSSTGLGLGLCRWIVEAHAGRIEIASPPSQGATFTVWLPSSSATA